MRKIGPFLITLASSCWSVQCVDHPLSLYHVLCTSCYCFEKKLVSDALMLTSLAIDQGIVLFHCARSSVVLLSALCHICFGLSTTGLHV